MSKTREAVTWYLRHKLLQLLADGIYEQKEIANRMGIADTRLIYLKQEAKGAGFALLDAFARYFKTTPDVLVRESLIWWDNGGAELSQREVAKMNREREEAQNEIVKHTPKERRTVSSERPSVKLAAAPISTPTPLPEKRRRGA